MSSQTISDLAIVIPAYKINYLDKTLLSIARQTCKDFTVYIGNDASPYDLKSIVDKYRDQIRIIYKYFDNNLGNSDLVAHWERCIDLVGNEKWIWLFSDDDLMETTCVEHFYDTLKESSDFDVYHFDVLQIDENENIIGHSTTYPEVLLTEEFLERRLRGGFNSYVVEFIFRKSGFYEKDRFENFDLAWCSDDATWIKLGENSGIRSIEKSKVLWRRSSFNITPDLNPGILERKFNSEISFANWVVEQTQKKIIRADPFIINKLLKSWFLRSIKSKINLLTLEQVTVFITKFYSNINEENAENQMILFFYYKSRIYAFLTDKIKRLIHLKYFRSGLRVGATIFSE